MSGPTISRDEAVAQFLDAAVEAGLRISGEPIADGKVHRVAVEGTDKKSGGYVLHLDERPAGTIWNYKSGYKSGWSASAPIVPLTADQRKEREVRQSAERESEERDRINREESLARWVSNGWHGATFVDTHPYLIAKHAEMGSGDLRVAGDGRLLVPMHDVDGKIWNVQRISDDGEKKYVKGARKTGMHHRLGKFDPTRPLILAEGYATASTVREATGQNVAVCFDSGNLLPVAKAYRERYPNLRIIIAADNDHHLPKQQTATGRYLSNVGVEKATLAAAEVGAAVLIPEFADGHKGTDWNDYAAEHGLQAVRDKFEEQLQMDERLSEISQADAARETAIDRVNKLGGDLANSQKLLTLSFESMRARGVDSLSECWTRAADIAVEKLTSERGEFEQDPELEKKTEVDQERVYESWDAHHEDSRTPPRELETMTRDQVVAALQSGDSFRDKDMRGLDLSGLTFSGRDLSGSNLAGTINRGTTYDNCFALATDFSGAQFENASITGCNAAASIWNDAKMSNTVLSNNVLAHAQMKNVLVVGKAIYRPVPQQPQVQSRPAPAIDGSITLVDSLRHDAYRLTDILKKSGQRLNRIISGPSEKEKQLNGMMNAALRACGWDGIQGSQSLTSAYAEAQSSFLRLAKSGEFSQQQVEDRVDLFGRVIEEQKQKRLQQQSRVPEISGNDFRFADLSGARIIGVDVKANDFQNAVMKDLIIDGMSRDNQFHDLVTHLQKDSERELPSMEIAQNQNQSTNRALRNTNQRSSRSR